MKRNYLSVWFVSSIILIVVLLSLAIPWEPSGETWGYWIFARVFKETGRFIVTDRSPLYTLYLLPFTLLKYPLSVYLEYTVTTALCAVIYFIFFKRSLGIFLSLVATAAWIPFFQVSEPPVQKLALACALIAILIKEKRVSRGRNTLAYSLLIFSYLFRLTYAPLIIFFVLYDLLKVKKNGGLRTLLSIRPSIKNDWPIAVPIILFLTFILLQSPHKWNGTTFTSGEWMEYDVKKMPTIHYYNQTFIQENYWNLPVRDIYITNKVLFHGAKTVVGAIKENPEWVFAHIGKYVQQFIFAASNLTVIGQSDQSFPLSTLFNISIVILIGLGAFWGAATAYRKIFVAATFLILLATSTFTLSGSRYLFPLAPLFTMSAVWYGKNIAYLLLGKFKNKKLHKLVQLSSNAISIFLILVFSSGSTTYIPGTQRLGWVEAFDTLREGIVHGKTMPVMEANVNSNISYSLHASFPDISRVLKGCYGIMTLEHTFFAAFMDIPINNVYDVWEIPPNGRYGESSYNGLRINRINCLAVSHELLNGEGQPTNFAIRYASYIKPYEETLMKQGARRIDLPSYGYMVAL